MTTIFYINRQTGQKEEEKVFGKQAICLLYGNTFSAKTVGFFLLHFFAKWPFFATLYGWMQKMPFSKKKVLPFIQRFEMDTSEFARPAESFTSFNDFFIRSLKPACRPIDQAKAIIPADGRYTFFSKIASSDRFDVKNRTFCLQSLLRDEHAERYDGGSLVIARLCPTDCHRFYFPINCTPGKTRNINGKLFSVNPIATRDNPWIWGANFRCVTMLSSAHFGQVAFLEVGATNVGSIVQTYAPGEPVSKGQEKGYFEFGGSALLILFEKGRITFSEDLLELGKSGDEIRCLIGQPMGN